MTSKWRRVTDDHERVTVTSVTGGYSRYHHLLTHPQQPACVSVTASRACISAVWPQGAARAAAASSGTAAPAGLHPRPPLGSPRRTVLTAPPVGMPLPEARLAWCWQHCRRAAHGVNSPTDWFIERELSSRRTDALLEEFIPFEGYSSHCGLVMTMKFLILNYSLNLVLNVHSLALVSACQDFEM